MHDCAYRRMAAVIVLALAVLAASAAVVAETMPGTIRLAVDARQAPQKILHAHMQIPVQAGPLTLYYPKWIRRAHPGRAHYSSGGNEIQRQRESGAVAA